MGAADSCALRPDLVPSLLSDAVVLLCGKLLSNGIFDRSQVVKISPERLRQIDQLPLL